MYSVYPDDLKNTGLQLYVSRHFGNGSFQASGNGIQYASSDPNVTVNASGLVSATGSIAAGTTITITITDPSVPASTDAAHTRPTVTATITVVAK